MIPASMSDELKPAIHDAIEALATGDGATTEAIINQRTLMTLGCVVAVTNGTGQPNELLERTAEVVAQLLEDAANSLDSDPGESQDT